MHRISFWPILALALLAGPVRSQDRPEVAPQPPAQFSGEVEVSEVLIDVLVTDRDGNVILGLGPRDFEVREDGKPLEVTSATFYSNRRLLDRAKAGSLGIDPSRVPDRRLFVLFFDDQSARAAEAPALLNRQMRAARDATDWVENRLEPGDLVAVASFDKRLELQQDFTADREALVVAIQRAAAGRPAPKSWPSRRAADSDLPRLADRLATGDALRDATPSLEKALSTLAGAAAPVVGRKNLILFTSGFGRVGEFGTYVPEERLYQPMMRALNAGNVAVYVADLIPLGTAHQLDSALSRLAEDTGGRPFFELPDFRQPLARVSETTNGYYLVAFRAPHATGSSGYRSIAVTVGNPEFRVTARRGYRIGED